MSQNTKNPESREEALEIIELATDDIEVLTRAFDLITDICMELSADSEQEESDELQDDIATLYLH